EIFMDFHVTGENPVDQEVAAHITFFNTARPAYSLNYLTPQQYVDAWGIDSCLFGLSVRYQVWSDCQARSRVSSAQAGFTIAPYLIHSSLPNKDVSRESS
ncbi:MAG: hypothetical protein LUG45_02400, partial [Clostridiales bacterium]|nr:hypothetical protein [Clostridiales bacterium]